LHVEFVPGQFVQDFYDCNGEIHNKDNDYENIKRIQEAFAETPHTVHRHGHNPENDE
jgi:hypothetical protein